MDDGYEYHLFLSYSRKGNSSTWLRNHFQPLLTDLLIGLMDEHPKIFVDDQIESGSAWPESLANALHRSRCLVSLWTPPYFQSKWCMAEWHSFRKRERELGLGTPENPAGLVYPIVYSDRDCFPDEAKRTQYRDLSKFNYPELVFKESKLYLEFHDEVQKIAEELTTLFKRTPDWDQNWKPVRPELDPPFAPIFKRL